MRPINNKLKSVREIVNATNCLLCLQWIYLPTGDAFKRRWPHKQQAITKQSANKVNNQLVALVALRQTLQRSVELIENPQTMNVYVIFQRN